MTGGEKEAEEDDDWVLIDVSDYSGELESWEVLESYDVDAE